MEQIYRKEAMQRISSPEQLDALMTVTNPVGWLALVITLVVVVTLVIWGFTGRLPVVNHAPGILVHPGQVKGVYSLVSGQVVEMTVQVGEPVAEGRVVARIQPTEVFPKTARVDILAAEAGTVSDLLVRPGSVVTPGQRLLNLRNDSTELVALLFAPLDQGKRIHTGMPVRISPSTVREEDFGDVVGHVRHVSAGSVTQGEIEEILGNPDLVKVFLEGGQYAGAPILVEARLDRDLRNVSGYRWTSRNGPPFGLSANTFCEADVVTSEERPIDLVIPYMKKLLGAPVWQ